jgi:hypothetical protein
VTYELRIYRIKQGLMDDWLRIFRETLVPASEAAGTPVVAAWTNPDEPSEFVWVRYYDPSTPVADQKAAYLASPGRKELGDLGSRFLDSREVRFLEPAVHLDEVLSIDQ